LVFAGPECCRDYFATLDTFLRRCLGDQVADLYQIIIGAPHRVAQKMRDEVDAVHRDRHASQDAYYFNWQLNIDPLLQRPFIPTHSNMAALQLDPALPRHDLASQIRAAFSGIVAGNVKAFGIKEVAKHGPYAITGDPAIMEAIDELLRVFVREKRMKLGQGEKEYQPCYRLTGQ
jgi:hypothetical protein